MCAVNQPFHMRLDGGVIVWHLDTEVGGGHAVGLEI
jgi:hypothetical protein